MQRRLSRSGWHSLGGAEQRTRCQAGELKHSITELLTAGDSNEAGREKPHLQMEVAERR